MKQLTGKINGTDAKFEITITERYIANVKLHAMGQTQKLTFIVKSADMMKSLSNAQITEAIESITFEQVIQAIQDKTFEV